MTDLSGLTLAEGWRVLGQDEARQLGDWLYMAQWSRDVWTPWAPDLNKPIDHLLAIRRMDPSIDPAEPLRRELREAYRMLQWTLGEDWPANVSMEDELDEWLARNAAFAENK